jgi:hypothetical protein
VRHGDPSLMLEIWGVINTRGSDQSCATLAAYARIRRHTRQAPRRWLLTLKGIGRASANFDLQIVADLRSCI